MGTPFLEIGRDGQVAVVRLNRPERKNALSMDLIAQLHEAARELRDDTGTTAVVLCGGSEYFTAGVDLADPAFAGFMNQSTDEQRRIMAAAPRMCEAWERLEQLTICAIEGFCVGGGVTLASSLDLRVMARSAWIRAPEIDYGMNMSWGTLPRLVHLVGSARTKELIILARRVGAPECREWGFAQHLADDGHAEAVAMEIAQKAAEKPRHAVAMCKETVNALATAHDRMASHMDRDQFLYSVSTPEFAERVTAFLEGKKPE
ncbi:MAG: enoyl-CoA hydratase/isomerase family protein [Desulfatibacillaceae bacterium]